MSDRAWQAPEDPSRADAPSEIAAPDARLGAPIPGGWAPPSKPGLIPLRPIGFGALLIAPFRVLRHNPAATFGSSLIVQLVAGLVSAAVLVPFLFVMFGRLDDAQFMSPAEAEAVAAGAIAQTLLVMLVPLGLTFLATAFMQGVLVVEVASGTLGEKLGMGALWRRAAGRLGPLLGWTLLSSLAFLVAFVVVIGVSVAIGFALPAPLGPILAVVLGLLLLLALTAASVWLGTKLAIVPSIIVLERRGVFASMRRSWGLTNGYFWRTLGVLVIVAAAVGFATQIITTPISVLSTLLDPTLGVFEEPGGFSASETTIIVLTVLSFVLTILAGALAVVLQSALLGFIYVDLRMRTEGLDLELARFIELRDAGVPSDDPYLVRAQSAAQPSPASQPFAN